jgi:hypothetical protein
MANAEEFAIERGNSRLEVFGQLKSSVKIWYKKGLTSEQLGYRFVIAIQQG